MKRIWIIIGFAFVLFNQCRAAADWRVGTVAGNAGQKSLDGSASSARFNNPWGVAVDGSGNIYVADSASHVIRKVDINHNVSTFAGTIGVAGANDAINGPATSASFNLPQGIAFDGSGNLFVTDSGNNIIRKITPSSAVSTIAGTAGTSGTADGTGASAQFNNPEGIAFDASAGVLYVCDTWNHTIRKLTTDGTVWNVSTFAGTAGVAGNQNAIGTAASFSFPQGIAVDAAGSVYVADTANQLIRSIDPSGQVNTLAGTSGTTGSLNGSGGLFWDPTGIAVDAQKNVYVTDAFNHAVRKIDQGRNVMTIAGTAAVFGSGDGQTSAQFWSPQGITLDANGNLIVADTANGTIRMLYGNSISGWTVSTLAGFASIGSIDGKSTASQFLFPGGACVDNKGTIYIADTQNHTVRTVSSSGVTTILAGKSGVAGDANGADGDARFNAPQGIVCDASGDIYVADTGNHCIRKITMASGVTLFAGSPGGNAGYKDDVGTAALFNSPQALAIDAKYLYVADTWNHVIRKIAFADGTVTTLAGVPGIFGDTDGTGPSVGTNTARFYAPGGIAVDASGTVFVADTQNHTIRQITPSGVVSTIAGLAGNFGTATGNGADARFFLPHSIAVNGQGDVFVLDSGNHVIRQLTASATGWTVANFAGTPGSAGTTDGEVTTAQFFYPAALTINGSGVLAVADLANNTIREIGDCSTLVAGPTTLQMWTLGFLHNQPWVTGGTPPYQITVSGGHLPAGVQFEPDGTLRGVPFPLGTQHFIVNVTDAVGCAASATCSLEVMPSGNPADKWGPDLKVTSWNASAIHVPQWLNRAEVIGTVADTLGPVHTGVALVAYSIDGGPAELAELTAANSSPTALVSWSASVPLHWGANRLYVSAYDRRGNASTLLKHDYIVGIPRPILGIYSTFGYLTNSMGAGFIRRPPMSTQLQLTVDANGTYRGTVLISGRPYPIRGAFDIGGKSTAVVQRETDAPLSITLQLDGTSQSGRLHALISGGGWNASLQARHSAGSDAMRKVSPRLIAN